MLHSNNKAQTKPCNVTVTATRLKPIQILDPEPREEKKKKKEGLKIKHRKRKCVVTVIDIKADSALISDSPSNSVDDISRK